MVCLGEATSTKRYELLVLFTFVASLLLYLQTLAPSVSTIFDDSLEFQLVSYQLGIAHPTGYPLYTILGKMFTLFPVGDAAYRVNLLSAVCGALTAALVALTVAQLSGRRLAGFAAGVAFAVSPVFWSQSTIAEVYTLNSLFIALILYFALMWYGSVVETRASAVQQRKWLWLLAFIFGLGLTHHRSIVLLLPALLVFVFVAGRKAAFDRLTIIGIVVCVALPQLLYLYIPLRGVHLSSLDGSYENTLVGFLRHVTGIGYNTFLSDDPLSQTRSPAYYARLFYAQFGPTGLALSVLGFSFLLVRLRQAWALFATGFAVSTAFAFFYKVADVEVFFIPSFLFMALWLGLGLALLMEAVVWLVTWPGSRPARSVEVEMAPGSQPRDVWRPPMTMIGNWLAVIVPIAFLFVLYPRVSAAYSYQDRGRDWQVYDYGRDMLEQPLEKNAVVVGILGEMTLLKYFQQTEGLRPDVVTVAADDEDTRRQTVGDLLNAGTPVYLTRPLPGISEAYHLSAVGPLIRIQKRPGVVDVTPQFETNAQLTDAINLLGYSLNQVNRHGLHIVRLTLFWEVTDVVRDSYKVSARVYDDVGNLVGQTDAFPVHDAYPTIDWVTGDVIRDVYDIHILPGTPPGLHKVLILLYHPEDGQEVARTELGTVDIQSALSDPPLSQLGVDRIVHAKMLEGVELVGYSLPGEETVFEQGDRVPISLLWRLQDGTGRKGIFKTWLEGAEAWQVLPIPVPEHLDPSSQPTGFILLRQWANFPLTARVPDGRYSLRLAAYGTEGEAQLGQKQGLLLGHITVKGRERTFEVPEMGTQVGAILDRRVTLLGFDLDSRTHRPGDEIRLTLYWRARTEMDTSYKVFVHLIGADGTIVAQQDSIPHYGKWPTTGWAQDEVIPDEYTLSVPPTTPSGTYHLIAGMYRPDTGERLTATAGNDTPLGDYIPLTQITLK